MQQFQVKRGDFSIYQTASSQEAIDIPAGSVRLRVERFSFTANNITYAVAGDFLKYWEFFPPVCDASLEWGVIPVWGFAEVVEGDVDGVAIGDRFFGYWPPAEHVLAKPVKISSGGFHDATPHRAELPPAYNSYRRVARRGENNERADNEQMLLFPLFLTGYLIAQQLDEFDWYGASRVLILSGSSKTSLGLAYAMGEFEGAPASVGLTSAGNKAFLQSLDVYENCEDYDSLDALNDGVKTTIVDMAGNSELLGKLHSLLGDSMVKTVRVGMTHWDAPPTAEGVIDERSEMFFAPSRMIKLNKEWGREEFDKKTLGFILNAAARCRSWLELLEVEGIAGLSDSYHDILHGKLSPSQGLVVIMPE